jgi:hypothetical protein
MPGKERTYTPVPVRVSPTDRIHRHIDDLFAQDRPLPEILEEVARLGAPWGGVAPCGRELCCPLDNQASGGVGRG